MSNPVIGFKKAQNKTSTKYCFMFGLDAAHLLALRTMCKHVSDDKFTDTTTILLLGNGQLLDEAKNSTISHHMASINSALSEYVDSIMSSLQFSDDSDYISISLYSLSFLGLDLDMSEESSVRMEMIFLTVVIVMMVITLVLLVIATKLNTQKPFFPGNTPDLLFFRQAASIDLIAIFGFALKEIDKFDASTIGDQQDLFCLVSSMLNSESGKNLTDNEERVEYMDRKGTN